MAGAVYWVGQDGNIYLKGDGGVRNMGSAESKFARPDATGFYDPYADQADVDAGSISRINATRIDDPALASTSTPTGGGGGASNYEDKTNDIRVQQAGLAAADQQQESGLSAVDRSLNSLLGKYETESKANEGNYKTQSTTNRQNLLNDRQSSYVNAAQGRQGLFGTLASLGALSGSGIDLANRAVQNGANADLAGAEDTFGENQTGLDTAIGTFRQQDDMRRKDANTGADNARQNVRNEVAKSKQKFYANLADDYTAMGNSGEASRYADLAASLFPTLAKTSVPNSDIAYTAAAFTPGTLSSYLAGETSSRVSATPTQGRGGGFRAPGLVATIQDRKKERAGAAA